MKVLLICITLGETRSSRKKRKYILGRREHPPEIRPLRYCRILSSYPHVYLGNQYFSHQQQGNNQETMENGTQIICVSGRGTIFNLDTTCVLGLYFVDPGTQIIIKTPCVTSNNCSQNHCAGSH